jgi:hypothetical protein
MVLLDSMDKSTQKHSKQCLFKTIFSKYTIVSKRGLPALVSEEYLERYDAKQFKELVL